MKGILGAAFVLMLIGAAWVGAADLSVGYLEGKVEVQRDSSWIPLSIGDSVAPNETIRLDEGAYVELEGEGSSISLTQAGSYDLARLLQEERLIGHANAGKVISDHLTTLFGNPAPRSSPAFGVRSERPPIPEDPFGPGGDLSGSTGSGSPSTEPEKSAAAATGAENVPEKLDQASAPLPPEAQAHLYFALAYAESGDLRGAMEELSRAHPAAQDAWYPDYVLLKGRLLMQGFAFDEASAWLQSNEKLLAADAKRAPLYYLILGLSREGAGDRAKAALFLKRAAELAPGSDIETAARAVLDSK